MSRRIRRKRCAGCGKISFRDLAAAEFGARLLIRNLIRNGHQVEPMFAYRCPRVPEGWYHITRMAEATGRFAKTHPSIPLEAGPPPGYVPPVYRLTSDEFERLLGAEGRA